MIFYHVTRMGNEEGILREGLRPDRMNHWWDVAMDEDGEERIVRKLTGRKAVFLWGSLESARVAERSAAFNGLLDGATFRVRIPRSWVYSDATPGGEDEPEDRFACFRRIPPERLEIMHFGRWRRREYMEKLP